MSSSHLATWRRRRPMVECSDALLHPSPVCPHIWQMLVLVSFLEPQSRHTFGGSIVLCWSFVLMLKCVLWHVKHLKSQLWHREQCMDTLFPFCRHTYYQYARTAERSSLLANWKVRFKKHAKIKLGPMRRSRGYLLRRLGGWMWACRCLAM